MNDSRLPLLAAAYDQIRRRLPVIFPGLPERLKWQYQRRTCPLTRRGLEHLLPDQFLYGINISPRFRYVYVDNPKTGCSSLKSALVELEVKDQQSTLDWYDWNVFHNTLSSPLKRVTDLRHGKSLSALVAEGYTFVTFVRNPYTRLLSCYRDKIQGNHWQKQFILDRLQQTGQPLETPVTFAEFVRAVVGQDELEMDGHWRVQSAQVLYGIVPYDFVGRFERYDQDFVSFFTALGIPAEAIPESRHLNRSKAGTEEQCEDYYTRELQDLVYARYRRDFDNFGYAYELPR